MKSHLPSQTTRCRIGSEKSIWHFKFYKLPWKRGWWGFQTCQDGVERWQDRTWPGPWSSEDLSGLDSTNNTPGNIHLTKSIRTLFWTTFDSPRVPAGRSDALWGRRCRGRPCWRWSRSGGGSQRWESREKEENSSWRPWKSYSESSCSTDLISAQSDMMRKKV